ncbi:MAG TPA: chemotaxis protein CheW [Longimicrobiales bacterium]
MGRGRGTERRGAVRVQEASRSSDEARRVLEARARALAAAPAVAERADDEEFLLFRAGREVYAMALRWLTAVARPAEVAPLPGAEGPIIGVTLHRGELIDVIDLGALLGLDRITGAPGEWVVVVGGRERVGIAADELIGVRRYALDGPDGVRPPPEGAAERILGLVDDGVVVVDGRDLEHRVT